MCQVTRFHSKCIVPPAGTVPARSQEAHFE